LDEVARKSEALAFAFMKGEDCQGSELVLPKLLDIEKKLGKEKLSVIVISMISENGNDFDKDVKEKLKGVPFIPKGDRAKEIADKFKAVLEEIDVPHVFLIDARDQGAMKVLTDNAARNIYFHGDAAFPWSDEAIAAMKEREEKMKAEVKEKQKNLEFFAPSDNCHVVDKAGAAVELSTLQSAEVVGVYFSAHWCGPCRSFTPKLKELYEQAKEQGKSFEIIFVSSDQGQAQFDEYYEEMPWLSLSYDDRALKESLSDVFDVNGIPSLILLKGDGTLITDEGRSAVNYGLDYFPWDEEAMKRGNEEAEERQKQKLAQQKKDEEASYAEQEASGKIVLRRHKGTVEDIRVSANHEVKFDSFSTAAAPDAVVPPSVKAFYEITFKEGSGISQIGWATAEFTSCDTYSSDGVGDCKNSWGFDGQRVCKWHEGSTEWGKEFSPKNDNVLGVAFDNVEGRVLFGINGDWCEPMGVAFDSLALNHRMFPAITCQGMSVEVNFGDRDMKFGGPDPTFVSLVEALKV